MNWFFKLAFLGTIWIAVHMEEDISSKSHLSPKLDLIESLFKSSFENASYRKSFDGGRLRSKSVEDMPQDTLSNRQHGFHPANSDAKKLQYVWNAMHAVARHLPQIVSSNNKSIAMINVRELCSKHALENFGLDMNEKTCDPNLEYRSIDGTCNNLHNTRWGSATQPFERFVHSDYGDGVSTFRRSQQDKELPNPRKISRALSSSTKGEEPQVTLMLVQWGQFLDHDITLTPEREVRKEVSDIVDESSSMECCNEGLYANSISLGNDCVPINVTEDSFYKQDNRQCIRFVRSMPALRGCEYSPMEQINRNTAFVDGSMVYGSDADVAEFVRTGERGLLNTTMHVGNSQPLPPRGGDGFAHQCPLAETNDRCFLAGDVRVDEIPSLTAMHTTFIRLHNIIADDLCELNPGWCNNDEKLFQETRRIVIALIQQITYRDWLPLVVGQTLIEEHHLDLGSQGYSDTYDPNVNPNMRNVFATAAFRFGHSLIADVIKAAKQENNLKVPGNFFNIHVIENITTSPSSLLKGLTRCPSAPIDAVVEPAFTNNLFADEPSEDGNFYGLDLVSLNIQRGRDHGIPGYRAWRRFCGLEDIKTFNELKNIMSIDLVESFKQIYHNIDDIDLFPAGLAETSVGDGILGPTFSCIIARQFANTKHGDRFWYERKDHPKPFTPDQLISIRSHALVSILCRVSKHTSFGFQPNPFLVEAERNDVVDCSSYESINLQPWKDQGGSDGDGKCIKCDWPNGQQYWEHPSDCTKFIQCTPYGRQEMPCGPNTRWDQSILTCNHEIITACKTGAYDNQDGSCSNDGDGH